MMLKALTVSITVENRLVKGKRAINVYHNSTRSTHVVSHNHSAAFALENSGKSDYLHIGVDRGPGYLSGDFRIDIPSWLDIQFFSVGKFSFTHSPGTPVPVTSLLLPPGPPVWELTLTCGTGISVTNPPGGRYDRIILNDKI